MPERFLKFSREQCDNCSACDRHYRGIRAVAKIYEGIEFPATTWEYVGKEIKEATAACKTGALMVIVSDEHAEPAAIPSL